MRKRPGSAPDAVMANESRTGETSDAPGFVALPHETEAPGLVADPPGPSLGRRPGPRRGPRGDWLQSRPCGCPVPFIVGAVLLVPLYVTFFRWVGHIRHYDPGELLRPITYLLGHGGTLGEAIGLASDLGYRATEDTMLNSSSAAFSRARVWSGHVVDDVYGPGSLPTEHYVRRIVLSKSMASVDVPVADLTYSHETGVLVLDCLYYPDCDPVCEAEANSLIAACCAPWLISGVVMVLMAVLARYRRHPRDVVP